MDLVDDDEAETPKERLDASLLDRRHQPRVNDVWSDDQHSRALHQTRAVFLRDAPVDAHHLALDSSLRKRGAPPVLLLAAKRLHRVDREDPCVAVLGEKIDRGGLEDETLAGRRPGRNAYVLPILDRLERRMLVAIDPSGMTSPQEGRRGWRQL